MYSFLFTLHHIFVGTGDGITLKVYSHTVMKMVSIRVNCAYRYKIKTSSRRTNCTRSPIVTGCVAVLTSGTVSFRYDYRINGRRETLVIGQYGRDGISPGRSARRTDCCKEAA